MPNSVSTSSAQRLKQLACVFLKLGATAFGGPAAAIALMESEIVQRRGWLSRRDFLDFLGATNLIPGPNSTEMAIHVGRTVAGFPGLLVAGICFLSPAVVLVWALAWAYVRFGFLPQAQNLIFGIKPVMIAIILHALWRLSRAAFHSKSLILFSLAAVAANVSGLTELQTLIGTGLLAALWEMAKKWRKGEGQCCFFGATMAASSLVNLPFFSFLGPVFFTRLVELFFVFLKIGSVLFGGGYVLLAFLQADFVDERHWITAGQLVDAFAVGQLTPGPIVTAATFVGYLIAGNAGAGLATLGIFLPAFLFVIVSGPLVPILRKSAVAGAFLDGVTAAAIALMAVVSVDLSVACLTDWPAIAIGAVSLAVLFFLRLNPMWIVLAGLLPGLFLPK